MPIRLNATKLPAFAGGRVLLDFSSYPDGPNGGELLLPGLIELIPHLSSSRFTTMDGAGAMLLARLFGLTQTAG